MKNTLHVRKHEIRQLTLVFFLGEQKRLAALIFPRVLRMSVSLSKSNSSPESPLFSVK